MFAIITPTDDILFKVLGDFIEGLIDCKAVQGFVNRAAMPIGGFIAMTTLRQIRLSTNTTVYNDTFVEQDIFFDGEEVVFDGQTIAFGGTPNGTKAVTQAIEWTVQLDCYGADSAEWAGVLSTMLRDDYSCRYLESSGIQPIDADDPKLMPIVDGEQQYLHRWIVTARFQVNLDVLVPQQFFDQAVVEGIHSVDAETL